MKLLSKWIPRFIMQGSFIWAIWYLIWKYSKTVVIEETTNTMPIPILIVIVILISIITIGGFVILLLSYWEKIKTDRLSFITFLPFSVLFFGVIVLAKLLVNKVTILIEINTAQFLTDLTGYNSSMNVLLIGLGVGALIGAIGFAFEQRP